MAVTVRRPFEHGLQLLLNYTWAKSLDDDMVQGLIRATDTTRERSAQVQFVRKKKS